jgi:hypothetical protein
MPRSFTGWPSLILPRVGEDGRMESEYVLVPRKATKAMLEAAWADAHDEDAEGVWTSMIRAHEKSLVKEEEIRTAEDVDRRAF